MPWVTEFDHYAATKRDEYKRLEDSLINNKNMISGFLYQAGTYNQLLANVVNNVGDLSGDFLIKYEDKRDDYLLKYSKYEQDIENFLLDLQQAITKCNTIKNQWDSKVYTLVWEPYDEVSVK